MREAKRHIVMLNKGYPPWIGGIERHVRDISEHLVKRGWRITSVVCNEANFQTEESQNGVRIIRAPSIGRLFSLPIARKYSRFVNNQQPDLVHVHVPFPLVWSAVQNLPEEIPVVCSWHSDIIRQRFLRPLYTRSEQRFLARCAKIFPTSEALMQSSLALAAHQERCRIIPLALPANEMVSAEWLDHQAEQFRGQFETQLVLFVGRLVEYKGLRYLVQAMKQINAHLLIAGDGPLREKLNNLIQQNNLSHKIELLGSISEMEKKVLYRAADLFVLPSVSRNEAFGYALLEAMQAGCPVISTDLPTGVKIVNRHGETGLVVPPKNKEYLAAAMQKILGDNAVRSAYGRAAKRQVESTFRFEDTLDELESNYCELLGI